MQIVFYGSRSRTVFNRKDNVVTDGMMTLRASNQVSRNVLSYHF